VATAPEQFGARARQCQRDGLRAFRRCVPAGRTHAGSPHVARGAHAVRVSGVPAAPRAPGISLLAVAAVQSSVPAVPEALWFGARG
jgi:hypothetical protein